MHSSQMNLGRTCSCSLRKQATLIIMLPNLEANLYSYVKAGIIRNASPQGRTKRVHNVLFISSIEWLVRPRVGIPNSSTTDYLTTDTLCGRICCTYWASIEHGHNMSTSVI